MYLDSGYCPTLDVIIYVSDVVGGIEQRGETLNC